MKTFTRADFGPIEIGRDDCSSGTGGSFLDGSMNDNNDSSFKLVAIAECIRISPCNKTRGFCRFSSETLDASICLVLEVVSLDNEDPVSSIQDGNPRIFTVHHQLPRTFARN